MKLSKQHPDPVLRRLFEHFVIPQWRINSRYRAHPSTQNRGSKRNCFLHLNFARVVL